MKDLSSSDVPPSSQPARAFKTLGFCCAALLLCEASASAQSTVDASLETAPVVATPAAAPVEAPVVVTAAPAEPAPAPVMHEPVIAHPSPPIMDTAGKVAETEEAVVEAEAEAEKKEESWLGEGDIILSGYVEAYYSHNFNRPQNGITNNRWLDEKDNTFTLQTAVLDVEAKKGPFSAKVTLMFGPTADRWYFEGVRVPESEPGPLLSPSGYNNETWKHVQSAYAGYKAPIGDGVLVQGGLFPTQVGLEGAAVKDNWNWSRSNLFNFLPFFHVGARATYPITESLSVTGAVYNGWNQATDLNKGKSVSLQGSFAKDNFFVNALYIGGNERPRGDAAGNPWRNLFDVVAQGDVTDWLSLAADANTGWERSDIGNHAWAAGAIYARAKATNWLYFAARGDGIYESVPDAGGAILLGGANHIASGTFTAELRPVGDHFSFRVEYRHDDSDKDIPLFYKRGYSNGMQNVSATQNTLTLGMTGWF